MLLAYLFQIFEKLLKDSSLLVVDGYLIFSIVAGLIWFWRTNFDQAKIISALLLIFVTFATLLFLIPRGFIYFFYYHRIKKISLCPAIEMTTFDLGKWTNLLLRSQESNFCQKELWFTDKNIVKKLYGILVIPTPLWWSVLYYPLETTFLMF